MPRDRFSLLLLILGLISSLSFVGCPATDDDDDSATTDDDDATPPDDDDDDDSTPPIDDDDDATDPPPEELGCPGDALACDGSTADASGDTTGADSNISNWTAHCPDAIYDANWLGGEHVYEGGKIRALMPAWAVTCHKSQGSQWDTVIFVAHKSVGFLLSRSLFYVAVTRAERQVVVVGQQAAVDMAVRKVRDLRRRTLLGLWLAGERSAA